MRRGLMRSSFLPNENAPQPMVPKMKPARMLYGLKFNMSFVGVCWIDGEMRVLHVEVGPQNPRVLWETCMGLGIEV